MRFKTYDEAVDYYDENDLSAPGGIIVPVYSELRNEYGGYDIVGYDIEYIY
jgi:hypothetical protein